MRFYVSQVSCVWAAEPFFGTSCCGRDADDCGIEDGGMRERWWCSFNKQQKCVRDSAESAATIVRQHRRDVNSTHFWVLFLPRGVSAHIWEWMGQSHDSVPWDRFSLNYSGKSVLWRLLKRINCKREESRYPLSSANLWWISKQLYLLLGSDGREFIPIQRFHHKMQFCLFRVSSITAGWCLIYFHLFSWTGHSTSGSPLQSLNHAEFYLLSWHSIFPGSCTPVDGIFFLFCLYPLITWNTFIVSLYICCSK